MTYSPEQFHHDACGLGFITRPDGRDSHEILEQGLVILANLNHRGTVNADGMSGDGAGILTQIPHAFFRSTCAALGITLPAPGWYAIGTAFFWGSEDEIAGWQKELEETTAREGQVFLGWRDVPCMPEYIGQTAREVAPIIRQFFIERTIDSRETFERKLYVIRRTVHRKIERFSGPGHFYVGNLSTSTIVYKGLLQGTQVGDFYPDLRDPAYSSALALVHSRFSTNTLGNWAFAHPYRYLAHNGEINTLRGNLNWMRAREAQLDSPLFGDDMAKLRPIIQANIPDSATFDNALEFLVLGGRSLPHAIMTMVPEAWEGDHAMPEDRRAFYHYSTALMQPWDGPAAMSFTDGRIIGATLDRNGLRPARYFTTRDGTVVMASEDGVLPVDESEITSREKLSPGTMMLIDLESHTIKHNNEAKHLVVAQHPYRQWVIENSVSLRKATVQEPVVKTEPSTIAQRQRAFGYTNEDLRILMLPMAMHAKEADGSMGTDTALAVLSKRSRMFYDYFHQLFAQVTNPPIDPLRERSVMSLRVSLGREYNLLEDGPQHARRIILPSPVLTCDELGAIEALRHDAAFQSTTISCLWDLNKGPSGLRSGLHRLCDDATRAVQAGSAILVLSDRGITQNMLAIPSLLATSAVYQHLIRIGLGGRARLVVESADAREVHHIACLVAFGAAAVCPYLALETATGFLDEGLIDDKTPAQIERSFINALTKGLLKTISKMGISTVHSYWGSQLFEIVGLSEDLVDLHFTGASSRLNGADLEDIARECMWRHRSAFEDFDALPDELSPGGEYQFRSQGPPHRWNEKTVPLLQKAVRTNEYATWKAFSDAANASANEHMTLRSLLDIRPQNPAIAIEEVEPAAEIVKRFTTGAMSMGSLSQEAHESLALAMNAIGATSNSGEGGEDPARFASMEDGSSKRSAIKQVASGRFGVTAHYLVNADMLQIKVAQGAKPGEGGQLPGHKVSEEIARLRHATKGVGLISPPPHHDIYSIEDLAQLIYDLHLVNTAARVSVKLVSEIGVGTIAAGVVKARADHVVISGYDGGTGAAPQSSIKHTGVPWELGLAETQQLLVENGLRGRVKLQADGMLRTGRDVVIAALLGADEFGFATAPLVALGCVMMRVCHLNTCPVGVATQDPVLRARFAGQPEHVINYFFFVAEEVREILAMLGARTLDEVIGRVDYLDRTPNIGLGKARNIDLNCVLREPSGSAQARKHDPSQHVVTTISESFDARVMPELQDAILSGVHVERSFVVRNVDRSIGAGISGKIAMRYGADGLADHTIDLSLTGIAGQCFGVWGAKGLTLRLTGSCNDYTGKGLSGAILSVRASPAVQYEPHNAIITGNVALYGATSGQAFFAGRAGERFAVRNSGATTVVEGVGDHGCEYMTGGCVVILGSVGRNFGAGMSGGVAFVYEPEDILKTKANLEMIGLCAPEARDFAMLRTLLEEHVAMTASTFALSLLDDWEECCDGFCKVVPNDIKRLQDDRRNNAELAGMDNTFASPESSREMVQKS